MNTYNKNATLRYALPSALIAALGIIASLFGIGILGITQLVAKLARSMSAGKTLFDPVFLFLYPLAIITLFIGSICILITPLIHICISDAKKIEYAVRRGLYQYQYGNPLHLKDHEKQPGVKCRKERKGLFALTISATCRPIEEIAKLSSHISSTLNKGYRRYAVTRTVADLAFNHVTFYIEDVTVDNSLVVHNVNGLCSKEPTKLRIDKIHSIDLTCSQSMIFAGKTRSGKTTAVISLLLQVLHMRRDDYGSHVLIIDPKQAELSRLPHTVTPDEDGGARTILEAMREFAGSITIRQKVLNDLSEKDGNAVKWWDAGMKPSFLFLDEYAALRSLFPKRPSKDEPDYCLAEFDSLLKRIVTMGASSGSFAIISIAEASVDESSGGGIPAMIRSACTTKVLCKPTLPEARLLWNNEMLADFNTGRIYKAGDALFSSTDGIHDIPAYIHFPVMKFGEYGKLGKLLEQYYGK